MKYDKRKNPGMIAGVGRGQINGVAVKRGPCGKTWLVATDGCRAAFVACEPDEKGDNGAVDSVYDAAAFTVARKLAGANGRKPVAVALNGTATVRDMSGIATSFPKIDSRFPDVFAVIPPERTATICLNAKMLAELAKSLGSDSVRIDIVDDALPLRITPLWLDDSETASRDRSFGVMMPIAEL